ncbi:DUF6544 family protein [Chamaesiphon sp.]|uniref:DUF6920 family protein n=1 Tax=Chamaesiphon sp. TaxID=2814140 RepID=UPI003593E0B7
MITHKTKEVSLDELWESTPISDCASRTLGDRIFNLESLTNLHEITRSAIGRLEAESMWLPSVLCGDEVSWTSTESSELDSSLHSSFVVQGERAELDFTIDRSGRLKTFKLPRWGNPDGAESHYVDFGGILEEEGTFCGYTIPTSLRVGWYFGTDRYESEGEFFRCTLA